MSLGRTKRILVSVVIPVFNVEEYLRECMDSVLGQSLREIEVVCIDDGSTDGSGAILDEYAARDARVKAVHQKNAGVAAARNLGIDMASGDFIAFMDPDDLYPDNEVLSDLWRGAVEHGTKACGGGFMEFLPNGAIRTKFDPESTGMSFDRDSFVDYRKWQFEQGYVRFVYQRKALVENGISFPSYSRYQDPPFMARALSVIGSFYALSRPAYKYRVGRTCVDWFADGARKFKDLAAGLRDVAEFAKRNGLDGLLARQHARMFRDYRAQFLNGSLRRKAKKDIAAILSLLGYESFDAGRDAWDGAQGMPVKPKYTLRQKFWRWRHPAAVRAEEAAIEAERRHNEYVGDFDNFGKAYADGMAELRYGGVDHA